MKTFVRDHLFAPSPVELEDPVVLRNLSEPAPGKLLMDGFQRGINALTVHESGSTRVEDWLRLKETRPFRTEPRPFQYSNKSVFSRTVGEPRAGGFELEFAAFLDSEGNNVQSHAKNYLAVGFALDYVKSNGEISSDIPDFIVRDVHGTVWIVEAKGRVDIDVPRKMARLKQWCLDATAASADADAVTYRFVFVDEGGFKQHQPARMADLAASFTEYQD